MEHKTLRDEKLEFLKSRRSFMGIFNVYKYTPKALAVLERYISVYERFENNYYPEVTGLYDDEEHNFCVYAQKKIQGYFSIKWFMKLNVLLPREEIVKQLRIALDELRKYGIYYYDIHYNNILWNGKSLKLVDMDGAVIDNDRYVYYIYYNLVDFILELYFYYRHPLQQYYVPVFLERMQNTEIFSKAFMEYLELIYESMDKEAMEQIEPFLLELQDKEKVAYAIKHCF